jgi:hypothetical protein
MHFVGCFLRCILGPFEVIGVKCHEQTVWYLLSLGKYLDSL